MTLREEQSTFARDLVQLLIQATARGYEFTLGEVERTKEQQEMYMASGRSKTMNSMHLKRCAADIHWFKSGVLTYDVPELGKIWESLSPENSWGGNWPSFPDKPHFQRTV